MLIVLGLGFLMLVCVFVLVAMLLCNNSREEYECEEQVPGGFSGMQQNPALMQALQKSFANQTTMMSKTAVEEVDEVPYSYQCRTCSLVQTGENMAYSDNTCPHCGTTMDRD